MRAVLGLALVIGGLAVAYLIIVGRIGPASTGASSSSSSSTGTATGNPNNPPVGGIIGTIIGSLSGFTGAPSPSGAGGKAAN